LGFFAATKSPAKTYPRLAACSGGPAEKQLLGICAYLTFRTQLASFSTVRSGKSLTRLFVRPHLSPAGLFVPPAAGIIISPSFFATDATRNPNGTIGDGGRQTTTHRRSDERRPCYGRTDRMTLVENGQRRIRRTNAAVEARTDRRRRRRRLGHRDTNKREAGHLVCFVFTAKNQPTEARLYHLIILARVGLEVPPMLQMDTDRKQTGEFPVAVPQRVASWPGTQKEPESCATMPPAIRSKE
jgi:hypothetical protein